MAHGKRYQKRAALVDSKKSYALADAAALVVTTSPARFDASVEVHVRLGIDPKKGEQQVRGTVSLPHGTGKSKRVVAFVPADREADARAAGADLVGGKELIDQIRTTEHIEFDVAVATPDLMKDLATIAKILGPRGLMPSPKNDTVTPKIAEAIRELKGGRVAFKNDATSNVHQIIGKASWGAEKILENATTFLDAIRRAKPPSAKGTYIQSAFLTTTMGPSVKVQL
ncbi:50S ribosomal protein L1 [Candidatus Uhrbacteria bacterium]|nr:50S ribosomal protein L1 [Candidatus Uhrbacteria bacterium]